MISPSVDGQYSSFTWALIFPKSCMDETLMFRTGRESKHPPNSRERKFEETDLQVLVFLFLVWKNILLSYYNYI